MKIAGPTTDHGVIRHWAETHHAVAIETLPDHVDHVPSVLRLELSSMMAGRVGVRVLMWEEFFLKFDLLGLTFVYDEETGGYNELLQVEERSPYRSLMQALPDRRN